MSNEQERHYLFVKLLNNLSLAKYCLLTVIAQPYGFIDETQIGVPTYQCDETLACLVNDSFAFGNFLVLQWK